MHPKQYAKCVLYVLLRFTDSDLPITTDAVSSNPTQTMQHYVIKIVSDLWHVGGFFFWGTSVSSTNKTDRHDITEILLKVALSTINRPTRLWLPIWYLQTFLIIKMDNFAPLLIFSKKNKTKNNRSILWNIADWSHFYLILTGSGVLVNQAAPWRTADSFCKSYGSLIGLYNMIGSCAVSSNNIKRESWIGLFRNQVDLHLKSEFFACLFVCLFVCLFACLFVCLFVCMFVCLFYGV